MTSLWDWSGSPGCVTTTLVCVGLDFYIPKSISLPTPQKPIHIGSCPSLTYAVKKTKYVSNSTENQLHRYPRKLGLFLKGDRVPHLVRQLFRSFWPSLVTRYIYSSSEFWCYFYWIKSGRWPSCAWERLGWTMILQCGTLLFCSRRRAYNRLASSRI